jgi:hypothetical protein
VAYRALTDVYLGLAPTAHPGDILPDTFPDMSGDAVPVNFDRLVEIGAAEKVTAKAAKAAQTAEPPADDPPQE